MTTTENTRTADLTGITIAHRLMRTDLHRLVPVAERIAAGEECGRRRAAALARWTELLCHEIHDHHVAEDDVAWPVIEECAGHAVDLTELSEDHAALDPVLEAVTTAAAALRGAGDDTRAQRAGELATHLQVLRAEIDEHLEAEEADLFPVIARYVPAEKWDAVVEKIQKGGPGLRFVLPRFLDVVTDDEYTLMLAKAGPILPLFAKVLRPGHRRRERLVFGQVSA